MKIKNSVWRGTLAAACLAAAAGAPTIDAAASVRAGTVEWLAIDDARTIDCPATVAGLNTTSDSTCITTTMNANALRKHVKNLLRGAKSDRSVASDGWRYAAGGRRRRLLVEQAYFDLAHADDGTIAIVPVNCLEVRSDVRRADELELLPRMIEMARPAYPEAARVTPTEGFAVIQLVVGPNGRVLDACVAAERPQGVDFGRSSLEAVRRSSFAPGEIEGVAVPSMMTVSHRYWFGGSR